MFLSQLQEAIEHGRTVQLTIEPERSVLFFIIRIKKLAPNQYIWQHKCLMRQEEGEGKFVSTQTVAHPDWSSLTQDIKGEQTTSGRWIITDEDLDPFLPAHRVDVPQTQ